MKQLCFLLLTCVCPAVAQVPFVNPTGVVNAASYAAPVLPNGSIAEGSLFLVYGTTLGPGTLQQASSYPLPTTLAGTSISVTVGNYTVAAIMVYTSASQVAAILPSGTPTGSATLKLTYNGQTSGPIAINVIQSSFGIFTINQAGTGAGVITDTNYVVNGASTSAHAGDINIIWGTGLGPVVGDEATAPQPGNLDYIPIQVLVGNQPATVTYHGRAGCCSGLDQIAFVVPPGVQGCNVPVAVQTGSAVSNYATMAIGATGAQCSEPAALSPSLPPIRIPANGIAGGTVALSHLTTLQGAATASVIDSVSANFYRYNPLTSTVTSMQTSVGTCTVSTYAGISGSNSQWLNTAGSLDAGSSILMTGSAGTQTLPQQSPGSYYATLGAPLSLNAGTYTFSNGTGGKDIGPFSGASITIPAPLTWTNASALTNINRANPLTITWSGGDPSLYVQINGSSVQLGSSAGTTSGGYFICNVPASAQMFTVPVNVLESLPAGNIGSLTVSSLAPPVLFTAPGLDLGTITSSAATVQTVTFQ